MLICIFTKAFVLEAFVEWNEPFHVNCLLILNCQWRSHQSTLYYVQVCTYRYSWSHTCKILMIMNTVWIVYLQGVMFCIYSLCWISWNGQLTDVLSAFHELPLASSFHWGHASRSPPGSPAKQNSGQKIPRICPVVERRMRTSTLDGTTVTTPWQV